MVWSQESSCLINTLYINSDEKLIFIKATVIYVVLSVVIIIAAGQLTQKYITEKTVSQLTINAKNKSVVLRSWLSGFKSDALFHKRVPPTLGIIRAIKNKDVDLNENDSFEAWRSRLNVIYRAFISANPEISQIRFIGLANNGRELVRVERVGGQLISAPSNKLQEKGHRDYFIAISKLKNNELYVSDITLNQENGKVEVPFVPVIRFGTPVYSDDGQLFGMVIINIDATKILSEIKDNHSNGDQIQTIVVSKNSDYIVHPDNSLIFGFDLGKPHQLWNDFTKISEQELQPSHANDFLTQQGNFYFSLQHVELEPHNSDRSLAILTMLPKSNIQSQVQKAYLYAAVVLLLLGIIIGGYIYHRRIQQHLLREQLRLNSSVNLEERFRQIVEAAPNAMVTVDQTGIIELVNAQAEEIFGYERSELIGQPIEILLPERFRNNHPGFRNSYFNEPESRPMGTGRDLYGLHKDGHEFPVEIGLSSIQTEKDLKVLSSIIDLTERQSHELRFRQVVETAPNAIVMLNETGNIELVNAQAENIFGYTRSELIGQSMEMLLPERFREKHPALRNSYFSSPEPRPMGIGRDLFGLHKNGSEFPVEIGLSPIQTNDGVKVLSAIIDISERQQFIEQLKRTNAELKKFAYVASHDLKAPLRGVDQLATWLEEDLAEKVDKDDTEHFRLMRVRIKRMEGLLDDLLSYSRIGHIGGDVELINCKDLIQDTFELCEALIRDNFDLPYTPTGFNLNFVGDFSAFRTAKVPFEMVFRNLISNAIKHHDKATGEITIRIKRMARYFEFEVADDGPGIPLEHTEKVFGMFQTLRPRDEVEGSGMGLAIVEKTIELFGGKISLSENKPRGTVFRFTWPSDME